MRSDWLTAIVIVLLLALSTAGFLYAQTGAEDSELVMTIVIIVVAFSATIATISMRFILLGINKKWAYYWSLIALGVTLWFLAEVAWAIQAHTDVILLGLTVADLGYILGYVPLLAGLYLADKNTVSLAGRQDAVMAVAFGVIAFSIGTFVLLPELSSDLPITAKVVAAMYPVLDLAVVWYSLRLASSFVGSRLQIPWLVFLSSFILFAAGDSWYIHLYDTGQYYIGHIYDLFYCISYIAAVAGSLLFQSMCRSPEFVEATEDIGQESTKLEELLMRKKGEASASVVTAHNFLGVDVAAARLFAKKRMCGVIVCFDRTYKDVLEEMELAGVKTECFHVVAVGRASGISPDNVVLVDNLSDLTSLKLAINSAMTCRQGNCKKFLIVDAIPTLSLYNDMNTLGQLAHDLNLEMREKGVYQLYLLSPRGDINRAIKRFCDTNVIFA